MNAERMVDALVAYTVALKTLHNAAHDAQMAAQAMQAAFGDTPRGAGAYASIFWGADTVERPHNVCRDLREAAMREIERTVGAGQALQLCIELHASQTHVEVVAVRDAD